MSIYKYVKNNILLEDYMGTKVDEDIKEFFEMIKEAPKYYDGKGMKDLLSTLESKFMDLKSFKVSNSSSFSDFVSKLDGGKYDNEDFLNILSNDFTYKVQQALNEFHTEYVKNAMGGMIQDVEGSDASDETKISFINTFKEKSFKFAERLTQIKNKRSEIEKELGEIKIKLKADKERTARQKDRHDEMNQKIESYKKILRTLFLISGVCLGVIALFFYYSIYKESKKQEFNFFSVLKIIVKLAANSFLALASAFMFYLALNKDALSIELIY